MTTTPRARISWPDPTIEVVGIVRNAEFFRSVLVRFIAHIENVVSAGHSRVVAGCMLCFIEHTYGLKGDHNDNGSGGEVH